MLKKLQVELPMILEVDNKGAVDFINGWSVSGRLRHIQNKMYYLRELKEAGLIKITWKKGEEMTSDIFTKNLPLKLLEKHGSKFYGEDGYHFKRYKEEEDDRDITGVSMNAYDEAIVEYEYYQELFATLIDE